MDFWVDIAEIIGALATSLALFFVAKATRHSRQTVEESQRMRRLEAERDERAITTAARRQAGRVAFWPVRGTIQGRTQWGIELVNSSEAPVFRLSIERAEGATRQGKVIPEIKATAKILPPGRYFFSDAQRWPSYVDPHQTLEPIPGNIDYMATVRFMDSDGLEWVRGVDGRLESGAVAQSPA
ncbi:hypothetical protein [Paenarthrobacter nitroguajacolicus]|uniref:hypothetical protein n=1 Tax=Paenarthrobacter nitroguajacolicus TaxID=211146 RepID=UPI00248C7F44|nr:hypothetical protein [Paenarthrobacter nitroguajacolicus]MDI2036771.1 hypothetical protein [Paenarthrobacter nitroguajacolicus]